LHQWQAPEVNLDLCRRYLTAICDLDARTGALEPQRAKPGGAERGGV